MSVSKNFLTCDLVIAALYFKDEDMISYPSCKQTLPALGEIRSRLSQFQIPNPKSQKERKKAHDLKIHRVCIFLPGRCSGPPAERSPAKRARNHCCNVPDRVIMSVLGHPPALSIARLGNSPHGSSFSHFRSFACRARRPFPHRETA